MGKFLFCFFTKTLFILAICTNNDVLQNCHARDSFHRAFQV